MHDVAVLGGGPGGYVAALRAAARGAKTCCIEVERLGGTCLNVGCIPTKAMLHVSELCWHIRDAARFGLQCAPASVDGNALMGRVRQVTENLGKGVQALLKARGVDVIRGRGRLAGGGGIRVQLADGEQMVQARSIIVATGSRPHRPAFLPASPRIMTTDQAAMATELPASILIIGGGVIGCEFATFYSELGIPTTVLEMLDRLAPGLDAEASDAIARSLRQRGVSVFTSARIADIRSDDSAVTATLAGGKALTAQFALAAVGRLPNVEDIGLESAGVCMDGKVVRVDDRCRTNVEGLYAVGDVAEPRQYAHLASRMGIVAADNAAGFPASDCRAVVPVGMYTHPEVAAVGLTEAQAKAQSAGVRTSRVPYSASGMAQAFGQAEGLVKIVADERTGLLLGALVIGPRATDVIQEIALAMRKGLTVSDVADTIHAHPTFVEALAEAADSWLRLPLHTA